VRAPPRSLTGGPRLSSSTSRRQLSRRRARVQPRLDVRAAPSPRARAPVGCFGLFKGRLHRATPPRPNPSSSATPRRRRITLAAPPLLLSSAAASPPSWTPTGGLQGGEEEDRVVCLRLRAPRRRVGLAGPPPPRLSAVHRPESPSPPLELPVAFVLRF
jgi:hypothetical protein